MGTTYRSKFEETVAKKLEEANVEYSYEAVKILYKLSEVRKYTPDFILPNGIVIETKGRFVAADRKKHLLIKEQCPDVDIRFVFQNPNVKLSKVSKTSYAQWCDKNGFKWAAKEIPQEWIDESL
jgi:hypothetical protein